MKFQFTPLREGRQLCKALVMHDGDISIHAPPRGATRLFRFGLLDFFYFNSRPSARGDRCPPSAFPRRSRISIHAPPRGATLPPTAEILSRTSISIHAPPRGATSCRVRRCAVSKRISIHAPPRGATLTQLMNTSLCLFQFTPLREGRQIVSAFSHSCLSFQFTPLREGRRSF